MDTHRHDPDQGNQSGQDADALLSRLERLVTGEATAQDEAALARWIAERPERRRVVDALRAQWGAVPESHDADAGWARLTERIRAVPTEASSGTEPGAASHPSRPFVVELSPRRSPLRVVVAVCAAAAIAVVAVRLDQAPPATVPAEPRVYATPAGQRGEIRLADGTKVLLAPESRVRAAADFGVQRRDVYVDGEAYFEVVHDSTRPFTVFAANTSTRDIGTAFAVRNYPGERAVRVVVSQGSVAMSGAGVLKQGDVGRLTDEGSVSVRHHADVGAILAWTRGDLGFADAPLAQVLADVRRWYGGRAVDVQVADSTLDSLPFTGSLQGVTPAQGIALVAATLGLRLEQRGGHLVLHRQ